MPYIAAHLRERLDPTAPIGAHGQPPLTSAANAGELNFQITKLVDRFVKEQGGNYAAINAAIGVLECAKLEAYRRIAQPYESTKLAQNGDVYS